MCFATPRAAAQEVANPPVYRSNRPYESEVEAAKSEPSAFHVTGGLDVRSQYFFRGYNRAGSGYIIQPYFTLLYTVYRDEHLAITPHAGAWFDITEVKGPENPQHWNEFRPIGGVAFDTAGFTFDVQYVMYKSPSDAFPRSEEVGVDVRYNDRPFWRGNKFLAALNPAAAYYYQIDDNGDGDRDSFFGFSLEPELHPVPVGPVPVTFSFPLTFGGSWDGYYFDSSGGVEQAGYVTGGLKAAIDLQPGHRTQKTRLEAEVDFVRLLADSAKRANGGDRDDVTFRVGIYFER